MGDAEREAGTALPCIVALFIGSAITALMGHFLKPVME
jgi:hypothetical protein